MQRIRTGLRTRGGRFYQGERFAALIKEMQRLSRTASECMLAEIGRPFHGPERPRAGRRQAR